MIYIPPPTKVLPLVLQAEMGAAILIMSTWKMANRYGAPPVQTDWIDINATSNGPTDLATLCGAIPVGIMEWVVFMDAEVICSIILFCLLIGA
jgi:hypothetical protein